MSEEEIIDNIARLNSQTWRDREEVRMEIGKLLAELKKALEQQPYEDEVQKVVDYLLTPKSKSTSEDCVVEDLLKEVSKQEKWLSDAGYNAYNVDIAFKSIVGAIQNMKKRGNEND